MEGCPKNIISYYSSAFTINPQRDAEVYVPIVSCFIVIVNIFFWNLLSRIPYSVSVSGFQIPRFSAAGLNCTCPSRFEDENRSENSTATEACLYSKDSDLENKVNPT